MAKIYKKTEEQLKVEKKIARIKELKQSPKVKDIFEYNDLKSGITSQPNPNKDIAGSIITKAIKCKIARKDFKEAKETYDPAKHQEKIREKRKEFERIITTRN